MYNSFEKEKIVFALRDTNHMIVPWSSHYKLSENGVYMIYKLLNSNKPTQYNNKNEIEELFKKIAPYQIRPFHKPLYITKTTIRLTGNSITTNESKPYKISPQ